MLDIKLLIKLDEIINIKSLCDKAGLNHNTIRQKLRRGTELSVKESTAIMNILKEYFDFIDKI